MARKTSVKRRLENLRKNKRKIKAALNKLPQFPGAPLPYKIITSASDPLVDAASIAFQQELLLKRLSNVEDQLIRNRMMAGEVQPLAGVSVPRELMSATGETVDVVEARLEQLPEEVLSDTEAVEAVLADIRSGRDVIRDSRQFSRANIVGGINLEKPKRTRRKTKTDKKMSKALRLANERFRKNNGQLRKGATQSKIMKYAHKLLKKM